MPHFFCWTMRSMNAESRQLLARITEPHPSELLDGHAHISEFSFSASCYGVIAYFPFLNQAVISENNKHIRWVAANSVVHAARYAQSRSELHKILSS